MMTPGVVDPTPAEVHLISSLLTTNEAMHYASVERRLTPDHFLNRRFGDVYRAMLELSNESGAYDRVSVTARVARNGLPNATAVVDEAAILPPRLSEVKLHVSVILEASMDRTLRTIATEIAGDDEPSVRAEKAMRSIMEVIDQTARRRPKLIGGPLADAVESAAAKRESGITGVPSGMRDLDRLTGGFQKENLVIVAARPGHGKSAMALDWCTYAARRQYTIGLWTLEMSDEEVSRRILASATGISVPRMKRGGLPYEALDSLLAAAKNDADIPLWVDDIVDLSINELRAKARRLHQRHNLDMVVVDYIQLMRKSPGLSTNDAVGEITRGLKVLASELEVPVIALSQLNRDVEKRSSVASGKRPQLSDLRDSGNIEQDANLVIFPFREGKYDPDCPAPNAVEILVPKHRDGPPAEPGDITVTWHPESMSFRDE